MTVFILTIIIFSLAILGLSLGVIFGRGSPQSCNGKSTEGDCSGCNKPCANKKQTQ